VWHIAKVSLMVPISVFSRLPDALNAVLRALDEAVMAASMKFIKPRPSPIRRRAQADGKR
jgi:hypothetical protein